MLRHEVQSSELRSVGYDTSASVPEAEFHSGEVYQYFDVSGGVLYWRCWRLHQSGGISMLTSDPSSGSRKCDNIIPRIFDLEIYR